MLDLIFKHEGKIFVATLLINLAIASGMLWLSGSAITSAVKALTQSCGQRYVVEAILKGDFFCPETKE